MGRFFLLVEMHQEEPAPAACAAGLFVYKEFKQQGNIAIFNVMIILGFFKLPRYHEEIVLNVRNKDVIFNF